MAVRGVRFGTSFRGPALLNGSRLEGQLKTRVAAGSGEMRARVMWRVEMSHWRRGRPMADDATIIGGRRLGLWPWWRRRRRWWWWYALAEVSRDRKEPKCRYLGASARCKRPIGADDMLRGVLSLAPPGKGDGEGRGKSQDAHMDSPASQSRVAMAVRLVLRMARGPGHDTAHETGRV